jgi:AmmeMemoRadiSam system protein B
MNRQPAVAGTFYPAEKHLLQRELSELVKDQPEKLKAKAIVVPHAGYVYSGAVAGEVYGSIQLPDTFIILCPNHTGYGSDFDLWSDGKWLTPLGSATVDEKLCKKLLDYFPRAERDGRAHIREHALEVQIPFLQYLKGEIRFVPLCIRQWHYDDLVQLGHAMSRIVKESDEPVLIIASSDMTHYESQKSAEVKDQLAIQQMEKLDPRGLYDTIHQYDISMCGYLPTTAAMIAAQDLGATSGKLIKYATSGDVTGDYGSVVGYAGIVF